MSRLSRWLGIDDLAESLDMLLERVEAMEQEMKIARPVPPGKIYSPTAIVEDAIADATPPGTGTYTLSVPLGDIVKGYERPHKRRDTHS